jgi:hypothetical protein
VDGYLGHPQVKMCVRHASGWRAYGSVPEALQLFEVQDGDYTFQRGLERGDMLELTATFEPSQDDASFAWFTRPRAKLVRAIEPAATAS